MKSASTDAVTPEVEIELFAFTHIGLKRKSNEDSFLVADLSRGVSGLSGAVRQHRLGDRGTLLLVSDGMGGAQAGEVASRMAVDHLHQELVVKRAEGSAEPRLLNAIERANLAIWHASQSGQFRTGMGTTVTAMIIEGKQAFIAEVGDSRAYVVRSGSIVQLTKDQSMVQRLIDEGIISAEEAQKHPNRNLILQALGTHRSVNVVMTNFDLCRGDILLLCTDGLTNKVPDAEIKDIVLGSLSIESACRNLIGAANRHGGDDNITVVVAKLTGLGLPMPAVELDTTDSHSVNQLKDRLRRSITGEIRLKPGRTQEIFRRTQPIVMSRSEHQVEAKQENETRKSPPVEDSFAPKFSALDGHRARNSKLIIIAVLVLVIILLAIKLML